MTDQSMVERVARAMIENLKSQGGGHTFDSEGKPRIYFDGVIAVDELTRAALEELREPTHEMLNANEDVQSSWTFSCGVCGGPKQTYDAMIDAALKEKADG